MSSTRTSSIPRFCFSQNALLWFEVLPEAHRFVAGAPRCCAMQRDPSPWRLAACNFPSEGTRVHQCRQSRPDQLGFSDGNQGSCWCTWVRPPGWSFAGKGGGKGDLSDNVSAASPSGWMSDHDALMIASVSKMYPMAVVCLFWTSDSFWVPHRFWLPCHISTKSWTLAILCNVLSSTSLFISESFSVFIVSNSGSAPAQIPLSARANYLTTPFSQTVSAVVFHFVQPITSRTMVNWPPLRHMRYDREDVMRHIGNISILWVCFLLSTPPVGYVQEPESTAYLHCVGVVINAIWIKLPPVLWCVGRRIQIQPGCSR